MEYVYTSPAKRRKISHTNVAFKDHFALEKQNNNNIVIHGATSGNDGQSLFRKKLLVLDVNGLLVDIVPNPDEAHKPDTVIASKAVFKRPFCDDFLKFCFQRFNVGVWTSRTRMNINRVLDFLMRETQHQLLFCWDQSHCTETGFNTIENTGKPLLLKELKKLWEKQEPNLPWDRGAYDESNTLLLDDSPYKALRNPPHTAIFPYTYSYRNTQDNDLGPNGDLRSYLERLAESDNVQKFIEQNSFGQQPITHDNESWNFYHKIICSTQPGAGLSRSRKKLIVIDIGGLLVDVRSAPREGFRADTMLGSKAVFKRPYCDEFLQFCFQRFNVGVWTSVLRCHTERAVDYLMRDTKHKLLFCWDLSHCTVTGFCTVENNEKPLLLKELRKLWEKKDPNLPWEIGDFDESNTLLVDNHSHRALLNPPYTAIFPYPYCHWHTTNNSLGPTGGLRLYLERLAAADNVQKFVSENPFGQRPIREKNLSWGFYQKIICKFSHNSSEPKPDTAIASVTKTSSDPITNSSTALAAPTLLEPKTDSTPTSAAHTLVEQETGTATAFVGQTLSEPDVDTASLDAQTSLEQKTIINDVSTAPTLLEPEFGTTTALVGHTSFEPETVTITMLSPPTLLKQEAATANITPSTMKTSGSEDEKSYQNRKRSRPAKLVGLEESSVTKKFVHSVDDVARGKRFQSLAGTKGNTNVVVLALEAVGSNDGKSYQKRRGGLQKLVDKKPTGVPKDGDGITTDLDEQQPLSVWFEQIRAHLVLKRSSGPSPVHHDKSVNQAIVTTSGTIADYQHDWPFVKMCPIWADIEPLVLHLTPPQKPHFSPLKNTNEFCREGLALAHMVTYWSLVQRLSNLKPNDPTDMINNGLEVLVDLEAHGFDVEAIRGRLNELLYSKSEASLCHDTRIELEKCNYEKLILQKEMDRLNVKMQKLQEKMVQTETKLKANEEERLTLQSNLHPISSEIND